jgi:hypothetical protein
MSKKKVKDDAGAELEGFVLANQEKYRRVIEGIVTREGKLAGGLGEGADPRDIIAHYDKLGGLILKDGKKIRTGSFWDAEKKKPREEPDVVFEHRSASGELFEYRGELEPVEVVAEKVSRARKEKADRKAKE